MPLAKIKKHVLYLYIDMPKKTLALICGLVLVTFILFVIALNNNNNNNLNQQKAAQQQAVQNTSQANQIATNNQQTTAQTEQAQVKSTLNISPNPVTILPGQSGTVAVNIDTSNNEVTAIQLEIAYDPNVITNVQVTPGDLITNPVVLINDNKKQNGNYIGRYTYAFGIMPNHPVIQGNGKVANITFTALNKTGASQLALLPETLVTARGISESVLKSATGTLIQVNQSGANSVGD